MHPKHGEQAAASESGGAHRARIVLFRPEDAQYEGRRARRARLLALRPVDQTEEITVDQSRTRRAGGMHWEYLLADDSTLLVRARDFVDDEEAKWDAERIFAAASRSRVVYVRDRESGQLAWWLAAGGELTLVASRLWLPTQRTAVVRSARRALSALRTRPEWGSYSP